MLPLFTPRDMTRIFLIGRDHITKVAQVMSRQGRDGRLLDLLVYLRALTACHLFPFLIYLDLDLDLDLNANCIRIRTS